MTSTVKRENRELVEKINLESKGEELLLGLFASPLIPTTTTVTRKISWTLTQDQCYTFFCVEPSAPFYLKAPLISVWRDFYSLIADCNCPGLLDLPSY